MADETPGGNEIWQLGLDIGPYLKSLADALQAYNKFAGALSKTISVQIDPSQIKNLSQMMGVQMRQAVGLMKGANKETVADSVKTVKAIQAEYGKLAGTGEAAFKRVKDAQKKAMTDMAVDAGAQGKKAGEAFGQAFAAGGTDQIAKARRRLEKEMGKAAASLPGSGGRNVAGLTNMVGGAGFFDVPTTMSANGKKVIVDLERMRDRIEAVRQAAQRMRESGGIFGNTGATTFGSLTPEGVFAMDAFGTPKQGRSALGGLLGSIERIVTRNQRQVNPADQSRLINKLGEVIATATRVWNGDRRAIYPQPTAAQREAADYFRRNQDLRIGRQPVIFPQPLADQRAAADAHQKSLRAGPEGIAQATRRLDLENKIGNSLVRNLGFLAKYVILYRVIHDTARLVQNAIQGFVRSGIEYTKELETQTLALRGVLSEQAKVSDAQGNELTGRAEMNALTAIARDQWGQIQQASLSVVGTTADLMQLYVGILPFTRKFGADLDQVQTLTKSAAIAARLMDISFQDARTAVVSILQGRALTRNKLVGALGFTKDEIKDLDNSGKLLEVLQARLDAFLALSDEAQTTVAAMTESIKDFSGILASGFTQPFIDMFRKVVTGLTDAPTAFKPGSGFHLFIKSMNGLQIRPELRAFMDFTTNAIKESVQPLKDFGAQIGGTNIGQMEKWVLALQEIIKGALTLTVMIVKLTLAMGDFIAQNRFVIETLMKWGPAVAVAYAGVGKFGASATSLIYGTGLLARGLNKVSGEVASVSPEMDKAAKAAGKTVVAVGGLHRVLATLSFAGALTGLEMMITSLGQMAQSANDAKKAIDGLASGDTQAVIAGTLGLLTSSRPGDRASGALGMTQQGINLQQGYNMSLFGAPFGTTGMNPAKTFNIAADREKNLQNLDRDLDAAAKKMADERVKAAAMQRQIEKDAKAKDMEALAKHTAELNKINAGLTIIEKDISDKAENRKKAQAEADAPGAYRQQAKDVLAQRAFVMSQLNELSGKGALPLAQYIGKALQMTADDKGASNIAGSTAAKWALKALPESLFDASKMKLKEGVTVTDVIQKVTERFNSLAAFLADTETSYQMYERGRRPGIEVRPLDKPEADEHTYQMKAPALIRTAERIMKSEIADIELAVAKRVKTEEQGTREIGQLEMMLSEYKKSVWKDERKHFEADTAKLDKAKRIKQKDQIENTRNVITDGFADADNDLKQAQAKLAEAEVRRADKMKEALNDAEGAYRSLYEEAYGGDVESRAAKFEKRFEDITQRLREFSNISDDAAGDVAKLLAALAGLKNPLLAKEVFESTLARTAKELESSRSIQSILQRDLQSGRVSPENYAIRSRQLRTDQVGLLRQQIGAYGGLASLRRQRMSSETDPEIIGRMTTEMKAFEAAAAAAAAEISDILSMSRRVEETLQAWETLTQRVQGFLAAGQALTVTNTVLGKMISLLNGAAGGFQNVLNSAVAFAKIPQAFNSFKGMFQDINGKGSILSSAKALGGLFTGGGSAFKSTLQSTSYAGIGGQSIQAGDVTGGASNFAKALPLIGFGLSAALGVASALFTRAVEKAKKKIKENFDRIGQSFTDGTTTLGEYTGQLQRERDRIVKQYSSSKSGRKALKEMLPDIDSQIQDAKARAKQAQQAFDDMFKRIQLGTGVFGDFARDLLDLEKTITDYLSSIDTSTAKGVENYAKALEKVGQFRDIWFKEAKARFQEQELGFMGEALSAQERFFSLLDEQKGLHRQMRDIDEQRADLAEAEADEQERRAEFQEKLNELAQKELDIRKQISEVLRKAREDEDAIRRRGVLEAQLTIAQQKATEISGVRNQAQEDIDNLREQLEELQDETKDSIADEAKAQARKDKDFARQRRSLSEREEEIRKAIRLNNIRLAGAKRVAEIEGSVFGMAADEFDLALMQNELAIKQAEVQVQKWRDTKALIESIKEDMEGMFFDPPDGFPQIHVKLGDIIIDNRDQSNVTINGGGSGGGGGDDGGGGGPGDRPEPRRPPRRPGDDQSFGSSSSSYSDYERKFVR